MNIKDVLFCILLALASAQAGFIYGSAVRSANPVIPVLEKLK